MKKKVNRYFLYSSLKRKKIANDRKGLYDISGLISNAPSDF